MCDCNCIVVYLNVWQPLSALYQTCICWRKNPLKNTVTIKGIVDIIEVGFSTVSAQICRCISCLSILNMPAACCFDTVVIWSKSNTDHLHGLCISYTPLQCDQLSPCLWGCMPECLNCSAHDWGKYILAVITWARTLSLIIKRAPLSCGRAAVPMHAKLRSDDDDRASLGVGDEGAGSLRVTSARLRSPAAAWDTRAPLQPSTWITYLTHTRCTHTDTDANANGIHFLLILYNVHAHISLVQGI